MKTARRRMLGSLLATGLLLGFVPAASADTGERDVPGIVTAASADSISVSDIKTKKVATFAVTAETVVLRGHETVTILDVKSGEVALVHGKKVNGREVATKILTNVPL